VNNELRELYQADRREHANVPQVNTPDYRAMRARDLERRQRVMEIVAQGVMLSAEDFFHAAQIMNHGDKAEDAKNAHQFELPSSKLG
jgi:hypothetical protein